MRSPVVLNFKGKSVAEIQHILESYVARGRVNYRPIPRIKMHRKPYIMSLQTGDGVYSNPRRQLLAGEKYHSLEIGFPNCNFSDKFIREYAEDVSKPQDTVYGYVPIAVLAQELYNLQNGVK